MADSASTVRIATVNVNGIRAAYRRGMADWLQGRDVDLLCLQEVRAPDKITRELLDEDVWHIHHAEASAKGRAGVAIAVGSATNTSRIPAAGSRTTSPCPTARPSR